MWSTARATARLWDSPPLEGILTTTLATATPNIQPRTLPNWTPGGPPGTQIWRTQRDGITALENAHATTYDGTNHGTHIKPETHAYTCHNGQEDLLHPSNPPTPAMGEEIPTNQRNKSADRFFSKTGSQCPRSQSQAQTHLPFGCSVVGVMWKPKISLNFQNKFHLSVCTWFLSNSLPAAVYSSGICQV